MSFRLVPLLIAVAAAFYILYSQSPTVLNFLQTQEKVSESEQVTQPLDITISESNPRWNHFPLKVFVDTSYPDLQPSYENDVIVALGEWDNAASFVTFSLVSSEGDADIMVRWVNRLKEGSKDTIGNTDLKFLSTERFKVIEEAEIQLLTREDGKDFNDLDTTNVAMHEIGHALGLDHVDVEESIMYPKLTIPSRELKGVSTLDLDSLNQIYRLPADADLIVTEANATKSTVVALLKTRYYANVSVTVANEGIQSVPESTLHITANGELVKTSSVPLLEVGSKYLFFFGNLEVNNDFSTVELVIDPTNLVKELDEGNNKVILRIS